MINIKKKKKKKTFTKGRIFHRSIQGNWITPALVCSITANYYVGPVSRHCNIKFIECSIDFSCATRLRQYNPSDASNKKKEVSKTIGATAIKCLIFHFYVRLTIWSRDITTNLSEVFKGYFILYKIIGRDSYVLRGSNSYFKSFS